MKLSLNPWKQRQEARQREAERLALAVAVQLRLLEIEEARTVLRDWSKQNPPQRFRPSGP